MREIVIERNDSQQRLDRFLKKYLRNLSLSSIYKIIRKDAKVNGKRVKEGYVLEEGDRLTLYIIEDLFPTERSFGKVEGTSSSMLRGSTSAINFIASSSEESRISCCNAGSSKANISKAKRQFKIVYEDDNVIMVSKPYGLLTHGDGREKKNHLANQVVDYLISSGSYVPRLEKSFVPSPANRLDRNTTGLVTFGKNAQALRELTKLFRERKLVHKYYLTMVYGTLTKELYLRNYMVKDEPKNRVRMVKNSNAEFGEDSAKAKEMITIARPLASQNGVSLCETEIITGRTHQIRVQLAGAGFPLLGDSKYGKRNIKIEKEIGMDKGGQLLHSYCLKFVPYEGFLGYLSGVDMGCGPGRFVDMPTGTLNAVATKVFGEDYLKKVRKQGVE